MQKDISLVNRRKGNDDENETVTESQIEEQTGLLKDDEDSSTTPPPNAIESEQERKKRMVKILRKWNLFLGATVILLLFYATASKHRRAAFRKRQIKRLDSLSETLQSQKKALSSKYEDLSTLISDQVGMVSKLHHEEEIERLKLNITKLEKKQIEEKDSKESKDNENEEKMKAKDEEITKLQEDLNAKKSSLESLEAEIQRHKDELAEVKTKMVQKEVLIEYFCSECEYKDPEKKRMGKCGERKDELIRDEKYTDEAAKMTIITASPSCIKRAPQETLVETPNDSSANSPSQLEGTEKKFCDYCNYNLGDISSTCRERKEAVMTEHSQPSDVAEESVMELDSNCIKIMKWCDSCIFTFPDKTRTTQCADRAHYIMQHYKKTEAEAKADLGKEDPNCLTEYKFCDNCIYTFGGEKAKCGKILFYDISHYKKPAYEAKLEIARDNPSCLNEVRFCGECLFTLPDGVKVSCNARVDYYVTDHGKKLGEAQEIVVNLDPSCHEQI